MLPRYDGASGDCKTAGVAQGRYTPKPRPHLHAFALHCNGLASACSPTGISRCKAAGAVRGRYTPYSAAS